MYQYVMIHADILQRKSYCTPKTFQHNVSNNNDFFLLQRDAMRKRGICCRPVSHLFVTFVYCIHMQTAEDIVKLLSQPCTVSPTILVFSIRSADTKFQTEPLQRGR